MIATNARTTRSTRNMAIQPAQVIGIKPRRADLVEDFQTGQWYLRAYAGGHFYWQPVAGSADAIPDRGAWSTGHEYYQAYWLNLGTFRRRADHYFATTARELSTRAA